MKKAELRKPAEVSLNQRLENGEFDQEVTRMIARLGLVDSSMTFQGFQAVESYTKALSPEDLRLGAKDILSEVKFSSSISVGRAQVASLELEWQKQYPQDNRLQHLIDVFDRFYESPTDENHEAFLEAYASIVNALKESDQDASEDEQERVALEPVLSSFADMEEELYTLYTEKKSAEYSKARDHAANSVKLNAEIQGVEKARDIMTDTLSQQVSS